MENNQENEVIDSIRDDLENAFNEVSNEAPKEVEHEIKEEIEEPVKENAKQRDSSGKFVKSEPKKEIEEVKISSEKPIENLPEAPRSWTTAEKEGWKDATPEIRQAVLRREQEVEKGFTKLDEERNFGKSLKEIITPYMPVIQAEGGTPQTAIQSLLNTAYVLRTAPISQKTALFHQLAKQYGVDLNSQAVQPNDVLAQTQRELSELRAQIQKQPEMFKQQQESIAVKSMIEAFAADPKNIHYEKLKPTMASLLQSGQAKDLQDAYNKASWADDEVRSQLISDQQKAAEAQRIAEVKAKAETAKKKVVSIKGSPGISPVANGNAHTSLREDLEAAFELHS